MAVHEVTVARSGAGKTYHIVWRLVHDWLPFPHNRNFFTNLPINCDRLAAYIVTTHPDLSSQGALAKIRLFDREVTDSWLNEKSGPWEFFDGLDVDAGRIVIDEVHNFIHVKSSAEYVMKWRKWLGELRHCGATFEAISQYETKIHPLIRHECGLIRRLASSDDKRDPLFWVRFGDHYQILSKIRGYYASRVFFSEFTDEAGKWLKTGGGSFPIIPKIYTLYDSYSAPIAKGAAAAKLSPHPYARMTWGELLQWYFSRNGIRIVGATGVYALLIYLFVFGGLVKFVMGVTESVTKSHPSTASSAGPNSSLVATDSTTSPSPAAPAAKVVLDEKVRPCLWTPRGVFTATGAPFVPGRAPAKSADPVGIHPAVSSAGAVPSVGGVSGRAPGR